MLLTETLPDDVRSALLHIQHDLFDLGGELSIPGYVLVKPEQVLQLDAWLDHYNANLPRLAEFILPGGSRAAAVAHVCRTVCRRAERALVARKAGVIREWIARGEMASVDPLHLFFTIWAATQTYADFESQVCAVLGVSHLGQRDYEQATDHLVRLLLRGCGLEPAGLAVELSSTRGENHEF